jgi:hypothetical protein
MNPFLGMDDWIRLLAEGGIPLFDMTSGLSLGPVHLIVQLIPASRSLGIRRSEDESDFSPPFRFNVQNSWS